MSTERIINIVWLRCRSIFYRLETKENFSSPNDWSLVYTNVGVRIAFPREAVPGNNSTVTYMLMATLPPHQSLSSLWGAE